MNRPPQFVRFAALAALVLTLAACGGGDGDNETTRAAFPSGGVRGTGGTIAYCGDFQLVEWSPLRFENNTWGREGVTGGDQCILARENETGIEFGWRWAWPPDRGQVKGYPEVHYGLKPFFDVPSSTPDMPIRIADIAEMTVRYTVDVTAEGLYNLAFDMLLSPDASFRVISHEIMVWVDRTEGVYGVSPQYTKGDGAIIDSIDSAAIDAANYNFHRQDNFDPHNITRPPGEVPDYINSIQQFVPADCPCSQDRYSGAVDLAAFYDWLVEEGHVDPSYYVTVIEFGNEVIEGSGETWLREYEVTVRGE